MRFMYVFDYMKADGYLFRAPEIVARVFVKLSRGTWDYAPTPEGL